MCISIAGVNTLKILMAGSLERTEHKYFESIALYLSKNTATENVVYQLQHEHNPSDFAEWKISDVNARYKTLQIGDKIDVDAAASQRQMSRIQRFHYDPKKSEYKNYVNLDLEHTEAYFDSKDALI
jgi:myo-inositol-hexaphosphate 3-phosphohydrolase